MRILARALTSFAVVGAACVPDLGGFSGGADGDAGTDALAPPAAPAPVPPPPDTDAGADAQADANVTCVLPTSVQTAHVIYDAPDAGPSSSVALTLTKAQNAGDFLVVGVNYDQSGCLAVSAIADTAGDAFKAIVAPDSMPGALTLETWGASNVGAAAAGDNQITVSFSGACTAQNVKVAEYASVDVEAPIDTSGSTHGAGAPSPTLTITTTHPATLFAHSADEHSATSAGVGFTLLFIDGWATLAEERTAPMPGMHLVDYAINQAENWVLQAVALRATCR
ncbi:MAG TPA: hypothetical protein VIF62_09705 [Labilithrix sp.]